VEQIPAPQALDGGRHVGLLSGELFGLPTPGLQLQGELVVAPPVLGPLLEAGKNRGAGSQPGVKLGLLGQIRHLDPLAARDRALISLLLPRQDARQGALADPVRPDQANPLPGAKCHAGPIQDKLGAKCLAKAVRHKQCHRPALPRTRLWRRG
jgi:hypothetical protein